ncbi:M50 family metallopeptidase [Phycicoccus flavus]|uniref:M50 family metallopeptidase n=1 Tax=Phycicoccus flavus TaxID=2502783 RepID=UPI000FEC10FB|nr:M50 family metallopeptidase [Phycicoccus flavus]NHA68841.1 M50 family metallopeptidase [Phycicoccus flavus]
MDVGEVWDRMRASGEVGLTGTPLVVVLVAALVVVGVRPLWQVLRLGVTLVHELGHALVGMLVGRRFTGFVLRGDMSGAAVTVGRARGPGRAVTTWAGYPAPAVVGGAGVWLGAHGWAGAVLAAVVLVLLLTLLRVRSGLTLLVVLVVGAATAWVWWAGEDLLRAQVVVGAGLVLVVGAWRHLGAVTASHEPGSDVAVLARLTHLPRVLWVASFALVCAGATWVAADTVLATLRTG